MANCRVSPSNAIDVYLTNRRVSYNFYGEYIYHNVYVEAQNSIPLGVNAQVVVYSLRPIEAKAGIGVGVSGSVYICHELSPAVGIGLGSSAELNRVIMLDAKLGVGVGSTAEIRSGNKIFITGISMNVPVKTKTIVTVYREAYLSDYNNMTLQDMYLRGNLQDVYWTER